MKTVDIIRTTMKELRITEFSVCNIINETETLNLQNRPCLLVQGMSQETQKMAFVECRQMRQKILFTNKKIFTQNHCKRLKKG